MLNNRRITIIWGLDPAAEGSLQLPFLWIMFPVTMWIDLLNLTTAEYLDVGVLALWVSFYLQLGIALLPRSVPVSRNCSYLLSRCILGMLDVYYSQYSRLMLISCHYLSRCVSPECRPCSSNKTDCWGQWGQWVSSVGIIGLEGCIWTLFTLMKLFPSFRYSYWVNGH